ncbi:metalloregulator ArsR/SmtB family transcription factor [Stieleria sp. JC731]|uniref:ArsR/SmtB family transcription factor n=1 Tax=Pirellulaceae TaxID=2691357 RepID=UPI001E597899|nr:metalloregulator ArsR/SmtB family transcription factor [Stieleria sp. JC731]MCC9600942.1 metalloregulator ArsR/SmtB family transcription factor [Stieleria sp. JC731]
MSATTQAKIAKQIASQADVFSALGDPTRLSLLCQLGEGSLYSITQLAEGRPQTRQSIRKHLQILESVRLVTATRRGREQLFQIEPKAIRSAAQSLEAIGRQWEDALGRLKDFVEGSSAK